MDIPADLRQLCFALNDFGLPRAIGHVTEKRLLLWNETFVRQSTLAEAELKHAEIELSVDLAQPSAKTRDIELIPFTLRTPGLSKIFLGHTVRRKDGYLLMMLDLAPGDILLQHFWQGRVLGQEEEKQRLAQIIHDSFSPHLLAALFLIHGIQEHMEKRYPRESEQLAKVAELLNETIQTLAAGVGSLCLSGCFSKPQAVV